MSARGLLFAGNIYLQAWVSGALSATLTGPFEGGKFAIQPQSEQVDMVSTGRDTFGQLIESVGIQKPADFTMSLREFSPDTLAIGLMGSVSALTQGSGNLTAVDVTAALGKWVPLTKANLTGLATVTNTGASVTYVEGTDYLLNRQLGMFMAMTGGAITDTQALKFTSAYGAIAGSRVLGGTTPNIRVKAILDGKNLADNSNVIVTVDQAVLSSNAALDFLSGKFSEVELKGRMVTLPGKTNPYSVDLRTTG